MIFPFFFIHVITVVIFEFYCTLHVLRNLLASMHLKYNEVCLISGQNVLDFIWKKVDSQVLPISYES